MTRLRDDSRSRRGRASGVSAQGSATRFSNPAVCETLRSDLQTVRHPVPIPCPVSRGLVARWPRVREGFAPAAEAFSKSVLGSLFLPTPTLWYLSQLGESSVFGSDLGGLRLPVSRCRNYRGRQTSEPKRVVNREALRYRANTVEGGDDHGVDG